MGFYIWLGDSTPKMDNQAEDYLGDHAGRKFVFVPGDLHN